MVDKSATITLSESFPMKKIVTFKKSRLERKSLKLASILSRELSRQSSPEAPPQLEPQNLATSSNSKIKRIQKSKNPGSFTVFKDKSPDHFEPKKAEKQSKFVLGNVNVNLASGSGSVSGGGGKGDRPGKKTRRQVILTSSDDLISYPRTSTNILVISSDCESVCDLVCSLSNDFRRKAQK